MAKLTTLLILISFMQLSAEVYAQAGKLDLKVKNLSILQVFEEIEDNSEYRFFYDNDQVDLTKKVSIDTKQEELANVLEELFTGTDLTYQVKDRLILVQSKNARIITTIAQQQNAVSGTVTDDSGQPLPGVTVVIKSTTRGTVTNADGNYSLTNIPNDATLVFSFVGMLTKEIEVGDQTTIDVVMEEDAIGIEEVVAVGYGTQKKISLTGSIAEIKSEKLTVSPVGNTTAAISGRLPGVFTKQTSGMPGDDNINISIRGYGSPLILVDGIQTDFSRIDPNEIESITVLKDASAAIYGARAGNGVILVTTKRGESGEPIIKFRNNFSIQQPVVNQNYVDAGGFAELWREGQLLEGVEPVIYVGGNLVDLTPEIVENFRRGKAPYYNTDWTDVLLRNNAPMYESNLSARGGSEKIKFFTSVGYLNQNSILASKDIAFKRYSARANIDATISKNITYKLDLAYRQEKKERPGGAISDIFNGLNFAQPIFPVVPGNTMASYTGNDQTSVHGFSEKNISGFNNTERDIFTGNMGLDYKIPFVKGLTIGAKLSYLYTGTFSKDRIYKFDIYTLNENGDIYKLHEKGSGGSLTEMFEKSTQLYPMVSVQYETQIKENHKISALLLAEQIEFTYKQFNGYREAFLSQNIHEFFAGSEIGQNVAGSSSETARKSYAGRLNYSFDDRYLLEGTFRYDATSNFPEPSRWGFFPSASAAWRISEEAFFESTLINNLKLRLGYSEAGVDNINNAFQHLIGFSVQGGNPYLFGNNQAYTRIRETGLPNPNATWENITSYNVGIDLAFWQGKLIFEGDVYYRKREGILARSLAEIPSTFGLSLPQENINSQNNRGLDALLTYQSKKRDFNYSITGNFSFSRAKWDHFEEIEYTDPDQIRINKRSGQWVNRIFGYETEGFFESKAQIDSWPVNNDNKEVPNSTLKPGDIIYKDQNGDDVIDFRDQVQLGFGNFPEISYGLGVAASYKQFSIDMLFQGASRFNMSIAGTPRSPFENEGATPYAFYEKYRWKPNDPTNPTANVNTEAKLPAVRSTGISVHNTKLSDVWLQDATYIRLKSLNFSYHLPEHLIKNVFNDVAISLSGTNLFTFSKLGIFKDTFDPEVSGVNTNGWLFPNQKSLSVGLEITF